MDTPQARQIAELEAAPARFLDQSEELRMGLTNEQLICEAVECNHAGVGISTLERYREHLVHFSQYLASVHRSDFYKANKKQVRLFMGHLEKQGGANPDPARLRCERCKARGLRPRPGSDGHPRPGALRDPVRPLGRAREPAAGAAGPEQIFDYRRDAVARELSPAP
jgi:hypothetical protein